MLMSGVACRMGWHRFKKSHWGDYKGTVKHLHFCEFQSLPWNLVWDVF